MPEAPTKLNAPDHKTLQQSFDELRERKAIGLLPFIPAGYPDCQTTTASLVALAGAGATAIEIGFPFSDPIADGPTIQEAFTAALARKLRIEDVFASVSAARQQAGIPLLGMASYSIVYRFGLSRFIAASKSAGIDALILPDLPPPEAQRVCELVQAGGLGTVLLVAPSTTPQRQHEIARLSSAFIYYLSVAGITGERAELPPGLGQGLRQLRDLTDRPICVGFGISQARHLAQLRGVAEGAIVGSAFVKIMKASAAEGPAGIAEACARYARQLLGGA